MVSFNHSTIKYEVKTYSPDSVKQPNTFYVLSKGLWSGRPMNRPRPNSFEVSTKSPEEKLRLFNYVYILWKCEHFSRELKGSVIPFIRISDFKNVLDKALYNPEIDHSKIRFVFSLIVGIRRKQLNLTDQIQKLKELENLCIRKYVRL